MSVGYLFLTVVAVILWIVIARGLMRTVPLDELDWRDQLFAGLWPITIPALVLICMLEFFWLRIINGKKLFQRIRAKCGRKS